MEDLKILNEKENNLFKRKEIQILVKSKITPDYTEVSKLISEKLSAPEENIKIKKVHGRFGSDDFTIELNVYDSKQDKDATEIKTKKELEEEKKASEGEAAAKEAEAQKEEAKAEDPTKKEAKPEEKPVEEKKE
ncbi:30S ribosomal protein S24e [archaeon BMS3Abin17]|nr:30S ribosomal protein S24e [archaeon BMS3Abin17]HDZ60109.1 hypothetical protein [Candidatus Pacearchaeota archaeon]